MFLLEGNGGDNLSIDKENKRNVCNTFLCTLNIVMMAKNRVKF